MPSGWSWQVFNDKTTGAPLLILFENKEQDSSAYDNIRYNPRPGHADFTAFRKFGGFNDYRGGGHFSGRITLGLVAAGVVAKKLIGDVNITANIVEAGGNKRLRKTLERLLKKEIQLGRSLNVGQQEFLSDLASRFSTLWNRC